MERFYYRARSDISISAKAVSLEAPRDGALWVVQVFAAILSLVAGLAKLSGDEQMIQMFTVIGLDQWLRRAMGFIEFVSATLLLIPVFCGIAALVLATTTSATILIHLFMIEGSPTLPIGLLLLVSIVAWGRKETTLRLLGCKRSSKAETLLDDHATAPSEGASARRPTFSLSFKTSDGNNKK